MSIHLIDKKKISEQLFMIKSSSSNVVHFPKKEKMKYITLKPSDALLFNEHVKAKAKKV